MFVHGLAHLSRAAAAEKLRIADATAAPQTSKGDYTQWATDHRFLAGL